MYCTNMQKQEIFYSVILFCLLDLQYYKFLKYYLSTCHQRSEEQEYLFLELLILLNIQK